MTPNEKNAMQRKALLACSDELKNLSQCIEEVTNEKYTQFGDEDVENWFELMKSVNIRKFLSKFYSCDCEHDGCAVCIFNDDTQSLKTDV